MSEVIIAVLGFLGGLLTCKILVKNNKSSNKSFNLFASKNKTKQSTKN